MTTESLWTDPSAVDELDVLAASPASESDPASGPGSNRASDPGSNTASDPDDDDYLDRDLPGRPLRKRLGMPTALLFAAALAAVAFFAGVTVEKSNAKSSSSSSVSSLAALAARFRAAASARGASGFGSTGGGGGLGGGGLGGGGVSGTITLVDGPNVYITQADGTIVRAVTSAGTQITVASAGTVASLRPGDNVTLTGPAGSNGDVTATSIRDSGAGGGGGGGGRRAGGGGSGGGGSSAPAAPSAPSGGGD